MREWKKNKRLKQVMAFLLVSSMLLTSLIEPNSIAASMEDPSMTPGETGNPDGTEIGILNEGEGIEIENSDEKTDEIKTLTYEDDSLVVTATTDVNNVFAAGDTLKVTSITAENAETAAQYDSISNTLQAKASGENYNLAGFLAYDIALVDANGNEMALNNDVTVSMNFKTLVRPYSVDFTTFGTNGYKITASELNDGQAVDLADDGRLYEWSVDTDFQLRQTTFASHSCREYAFAWMEEKVTETPEVTEIPEITEPPETTETPEATETPQLTETPEPTKEAKTLIKVVENDNVTVAVTEVDEGAIPENAELSVTPIQESDDAYKNVEIKLQEKAAKEAYDIAGFLAYDITFVDAAGNKVEPNGQVQVSLEYTNPVSPAGVGASESEINIEGEDEESKEAERASETQLTVMHLEEDADGNVKQVVDMDQSNQLKNIEITEKQEIQKVEFVTDGFSAYTVTWTVSERKEESNVYDGYDENAESLTTVDTVDHISAGITMRMINYDTAANGMSDTIGGGYGDGKIKKNLLQKVLQNGYPVTSDGADISSLFSGGQTVNHLFRQDIYDSTGYYEYSSFENYAYLEDSGNFTVYEQIGTPSNNTNYFYKRGNFMPYNKIEAGKFSTNTNLYDENGRKLTADDERYNEKLYKTQEENDFYFGMYMGANFVQPKEGKMSQTGQSMRYEFNGDDDLWIYIDHVLVLDIGGIHDAHSGYIDFATGEVGWYDCKTGGTPTLSTTTIKEMFRLAGTFPDGTIWDDNKAGNYFDGDTFKDYTSHTFKMFYMERGEGASNLHMKFNLEVVPEGQIQVTKQLTNTDKEKYANVEFAFQVYAQKILSTDSLGNETYSDTEYVPLTSAAYQGTNNLITFHDDVILGEGSSAKTYNHVFYLKPDQTAVFKNLKANRKYYVIEVGVNAKEYDKVIINGTEYKSYNEDQQITGVIEDVQTDAQEVGNRPVVVFENNCSVYNSRELRITKQMAAGQTTADTFSFQIYLTGQDGSLVPYADGDYYLKDQEGYYYYCNGNQLVKNVDAENASAKPSIVCGKTTSEGIVSGVPQDYTVVITSILSGTSFKVEEVNLSDSAYLDPEKNVKTGTYDSSSVNGADGAIKLGTDAEITITNQKKEWKIVKCSTSSKEQILSGAEFTLTSTDHTYYGKSASTTGKIEWYSDHTFKSDKKITESQIEAGSYTFAETKAPAGYMCSTDTWTIEIGQNGSLKNITGIKSGNTEISGNKTTCYFENAPSYDLPSTGGCGILWYAMSGMLFMMAAVFILYKNKCREVLRNK